MQLEESEFGEREWGGGSVYMCVTVCVCVSEKERKREEKNRKGETERD